ncbi:MAG: hypothetical protein HC883_05960 [Bdellovibrionaceae bacterium]|nr:hypothetical protein [Pseudobdellovibrionaceae bacterium]
MDDLWHALVIETIDYKKLCERLRPGAFVHHSGIPFDEYTSGLSTEKFTKSNAHGWHHIPQLLVRSPRRHSNT